MSLIALKSRKKTIDMIYRASCAMKAAAVVRVRKIEKCLSDFMIAHEMIESHESKVLESLFLGNVMQDHINCAQHKVDVLIACDKGMCGDFMNHISTYFKLNRDNGNYWLVFGSKLEVACSANAKTIFFGNTFLNQMELFAAANKLSQFLHEHSVCELNFHYFMKDKIIVKTLFSKEKMLEALRLNEGVSDIVTPNEVPQEFGCLLLASYLYTAMLHSMLQENKQRLVAMTQAKTNAEDMGKIIIRLYNKARQEKITLELNEITAGII